MKNLKRVLSFALATVMVIGMMVVGAGAAFTDADKIENTDAVNAMVALNVLNGKGDGTYFDPTGTLTRAEAAKIIVYVLHGGKAPVIGTKATPTYSDIAGNWAESFIEYCSAQGIIAGWDGKFTPAGELTGTAFAKMLMVAMGYNAEVFGFVGNDYEINVNVEANKIGLYEDLETIDPTKAVSRDDAAQMAYNALFAGIMEKTYSHNIVTGAVTNGYSLNTTIDLFSEKFGGDDVEGFLTAITYNEDTEKFTYTVGAKQMSTKADFTALAGQKVTALFKNVDGSVESCYGIYAANETVVATVGEIDATTIGGDANKVKVAGVEYELDVAETTIPVYVFAADAIATPAVYGLDATDGALYAYDEASTLTLLDTDDNGKFDRAIVAPVNVVKVTYVGTQSITAGANYTFKDNTIGSGIAKNDYVVITAETNLPDNVEGAKIEKVDFITGTVSGVKDTDTVLVNGKWYKDSATINPTVTLNKEVKMVVIGDYYYHYETTNADALVENLVSAIEVDTALSLGKLQAEFLTAAGEKVIATVAKVDNDGNGLGKVTISGSYDVAEDTLYTYAVKDGAWELTKVGTFNDLGMSYKADASANYWEATTKADAYVTVNSADYYIADDAVIFLTSTNGSGTDKVITGAALKNWSADATPGIYTLTKDTNGMTFVKVALVDLGANAAPAAGGETANYGYVVSNPYTVKEGDNSYLTYEIWNGKAVVTVMDKDQVSVSKKDVIEYTDLGAGKIDDVTKVTVDVAVIGYTDKALTVKVYEGTVDTYILDADTAYMYIDNQAGKGVEGGALALAGCPETDKSYTTNAKIYVADGIAKLVVVDVNNDLVDGANETRVAPLI